MRRDGAAGQKVWSAAGRKPLDATMWLFDVEAGDHSLAVSFCVLSTQDSDRPPPPHHRFKSVWCKTGVVTRDILRAVHHCLVSSSPYLHFETSHAP